MSKKLYVGKYKQRTNYKRIGFVIMGISFLVTGAVFARDYMVSQNIKEVKLLNQEMQETIDEIQVFAEQLETENDSVTDRIEEIEEILWRYEPVVIPDSMK